MVGSGNTRTGTGRPLRIALVGQDRRASLLRHRLHPKPMTQLVTSNLEVIALTASRFFPRGSTRFTCCFAVLYLVRHLCLSLPPVLNVLCCAAAAISGGTGVFLPNRPQPPPQPAHKPTASVPMSGPAPMTRAAAINKARLQAAANMAAGAPQPAAAYVPTSADLAASVHLAANGQLVHCGSSLPPSAYFMQDPFLSGNSSLASTIYTPTGTQDMQVRTA